MRRSKNDILERSVVLVLFKPCPKFNVSGFKDLPVRYDFYTTGSRYTCQVDVIRDR